MDNFDKFLLWEAKSRDTIDFKKIYVDIAGDLIAGLLLSQIIYWYLPGEKGKTKLRVLKQGYYWIAKERNDWWDEIRITPKQFDRASNILTRKGIIVKDHFRFNGLRTVHIRLEYDCFMELWQTELERPAFPQRGTPHFPKSKDRDTPKGKTGIHQKVRPLTETTAKNTTILNGCAKNPQKLTPQQKTEIALVGQHPNVNAPQCTDTERDALNRLGKVIAHSGNIGNIQTADELRAITLIGADIAKITETDILAIDLGELRALASFTIRVSTKPDIIEKLTEVGPWWYANDWRGQKGQPPTIKQLGSVWGQFEAARVVKVPSVQSDGDHGVYI
jgi:hypothetical protein